jgi:hypothetical protein
VSWLNCFRRAAVSKPQEYENTDPRDFYITSEALDAKQEYVRKFRDSLDECCKVILDERELTGMARLVTNEVIATAFYRVTNNLDKKEPQ